MQLGSSVCPISLALPAGKLVGEDVCPPGNVGNIVQPQCSVWILLLFVCDLMCVLSHHVASRVRGTVARIPFEEFHRHSAEIVRSGVFGRDEKDEIKSILHFMANNLVRAHI